jgi:hypothetical protein
MKLDHLIMSLALVACASTAAAQEGDEKKKADPTTPSKNIVQQENAIRGLARLRELEKELAGVTKLLEDLTRERKQAAAELKLERELTAARLKLKDEEIKSIRSEVQRKQALKEAVPTFELVGLVHTELRSFAVIQAGDRAYWARDKQQLQLELSTGAKVQVTCSIKSPDTIELAIPELSMTEIVSFHPTVLKSTPKARAAD